MVTISWPAFVLCSSHTCLSCCCMLFALLIRRMLLMEGEQAEPPGGGHEGTPGLSPSWEDQTLYHVPSSVLPYLCRSVGCPLPS